MGCSSGPSTLLLAPAALPTCSPPSPFPRGLSHEQPGGLLRPKLLHGEGSPLSPGGALVSRFIDYPAKYLGIGRNISIFLFYRKYV